MAKSSCQAPKAGVMLTALGLLLIVSLIFYQALENRQLTANLATRTQRLHRVKVMREMFWYNYLQIPKEVRPESGEVSFNQGQLTFFCEGSTFKVRVLCEERAYLYQYPDFTEEHQEKNEGEIP